MKSVVLKVSFENSVLVGSEDVVKSSGVSNRSAEADSHSFEVSGGVEGSLLHIRNGNFGTSNNVRGRKFGLDDVIVGS